MNSNFLKILFLLLFGASLNAFSQIHRFYYQLSYKPDKDSTKILEKMTVLDILNRESLYASYDQISFDSLATDGIKKMMKTGIDFNWGKMAQPPLLSSRVIKNGNEVIYKDRKDFMACQYKEKLSLPWKIQNETNDIESYSVQRATLNYWDRNWTAWFTTEIPIQDGPYKFFGLPGLIVKIEDDAHNYSWKLVGNKKYSSESGLEKMDYFEIQEGVDKLPIFEKKKCVQMFADYRKNYFNYSMQMFPEVNADLIQKLKEDNKRMQKIFQENDNEIELVSK